MMETAYDFQVKKAAKEGLTEDRAKAIVEALVENVKRFDRAIENGKDYVERGRWENTKDGFIKGFMSAVIFTMGCESQTLIEDLFEEAMED